MKNKSNAAAAVFPHVTAIIPAAGTSSRMNGIDKRLEDLGGMPVLARTLEALDGSEWITDIILSVQTNDIPIMFEMARAYGIAKLRSVVSGGATRQQSVLKALDAVGDDTQYIAIHDGARPLVSQQVIANAVLGAVSYGAAAAAIQVTDTIKQADDKRMVVATPPRSSLFAVQTPQVFRLSQYLKAAKAAADSGKDYTDDCQMLEAIGVAVHLSQGGNENIKITTPVDLLTARALFERQEDGRL